MKILFLLFLCIFLQYQQLMAFLTEMLHTDVFCQEAWGLPNVLVQLQEEDKTFRGVEMCIFKIFLSS